MKIKSPSTKKPRLTQMSWAILKNIYNMLPAFAKDP